MFYCPQCNIELPAEAKFCMQCGVRQASARIQPAIAIKSPSLKIEPPGTLSEGELPDTPIPDSPQSSAEVGKEELHIADLPTQQYPAASQVSQQPNSQSIAKVQEEIEQAEKIAHISTHPLPIETTQFVEDSSETTYMSTNVDSETIRKGYRWRQSWRDRQRAEAGPALDTSRGQAVVPEPLRAMQHSLGRMRAILLNHNPTDHGKNFRFWTLLVLLLCLSIGLSGYSLSTFMVASPPLSQHLEMLSNPTNFLSVGPLLSTPETKGTPIRAGQALHVHGERFSVSALITFALNDTSVKMINGQPVLAQCTPQGTFDIQLPIDPTWLAGNYALQAQDHRTGQHASLDIHILPTKDDPTNTTPLMLFIGEQPATELNFTATADQDEITGQGVLLNNTNTSEIQWRVTTITDDNANWLAIDKARGDLAGNGRDSIYVSIHPGGLKKSSWKYTGYIIFTINDQQQVLLPVTLHLKGPPIEMLINPTQIITQLTQTKSCAPTTLTLINFSDVAITWNVTPYANDQAHIHLDGQSALQGILQPADHPDDTRVIHITCIDVQTGDNLYHLTVSYNLNTGGATQDVTISIRR